MKLCKNEIANLVSTRQIIGLIKELRTGTGLGLKEAKDRVEGCRNSWGELDHDQVITLFRQHGWFEEDAKKEIEKKVTEEETKDRQARALALVFALKKMVGRAESSAMLEVITELENTVAGYNVSEGEEE